MKQIVKVYCIVFAFVLGCGFALHKTSGNNVAYPYKPGDIIFITSSSGQGKAIQLATKSKYTHVGIILQDGPDMMVYHAVEPVKKSTFNDFLKYSEDGQYELMRLKNPQVLDAKTLAGVTDEARKMLGKHYDLAFAWDDKELYCSEYVWKLYKHNANLEIGQPKPLGSFDLSNPIVKKKLEERYGNNIPLNENMISPGDMHDSPLLVKVN